MDEVLVVPASKVGLYTLLYSNRFLIISIDVTGNLNLIKKRIDCILKKMESYPDKKFRVSKFIRENDDIVSMFALAPANCYLPSIWRWELPSGGEFSFWNSYI